MDDYLDDLDFGSTTATRAATPLREDLSPVHGLVDGVKAAAILGLENQKRVSVWLSKKAKAIEGGRELSPLLAALPEPAGFLNGAPVFTEESIVTFGIEAGFLEEDVEVGVEPGRLAEADDDDSF